MGKYERTGIDTGNKKEYMRIYKQKFKQRRRDKVRYLVCDKCDGRFTSEHAIPHKKLKKHLRAIKYLEENDDFEVPSFEPIDMNEFYWKEDFF